VAEAGNMISAEFPPFPCVLPHPWKSAICRSSVPTDPRAGTALVKLCPPRKTSTKGQKGQPNSSRGVQVKNRLERQETNSPNSQTHTPAERYAWMVEERMRDLAEGL
jgi:hypothetical protein